jgi:biopolymer transport protein ExbD
MSHGSTDRCEPNFTPLLDLVLQLVMFFMLCANFVMEETSVEVKLPEANAAKALDKDTTEAIFLNVNDKGQVLLAPTQREKEGEDTLDNPIQVENYMKRRAAIETRRTGKDKPQATLVLRIDKACQFEKSYPIMKACRNAGYTKVELRALLGQGKG